MTGKEIRAIDCMAQHIGTFLDQAHDKERADFGEPCEKCLFAEDCDFDWLGTMIPVLKYGSVKGAIRMMRESAAELPEKEGEENGSTEPNS